MTFTIKLHIQGVCNFIPHVNGSELLVAFPDQHSTTGRRIKEPSGQDICEHAMVVQFDPRHVNRDMPENLWTTRLLERELLRIDTNSRTALDVSNPETIGVAPLHQIIAREQYEQRHLHVSESVLAANDPRLKAMLYLDSGDVTPNGDYVRPWVFNGYARTDSPVRGSFASVVTVRYQEATRFSLCLRAFGHEVDEVLSLEPFAEGSDGEPPEVEIWLRHFCDLVKPGVRTADLRPGDPDEDFPLNYVLLNDVDALIDQVGEARLPHPTVEESWVDNKPIIGEDPAVCGATRLAAIDFVSPFEVAR